MEDRFVDTLYEFKCLWDRPSKCGLKIIEGSEKLLVIFTELYNDNPGTSITNASALLATQFLKERNLDPQKVIFVEHTPDNTSKLSFYDEAFYIVTYNWTGDAFENPVWEQVGLDRIEELIKSI